MKQEWIDTGWAWTRKFNLSPGVKLGDTIHVSGMVAFADDGSVVGEDDMYAQAVQVFRNIEGVLKAGGAAMDDVVKLTSWVVDMDRFGDFSRARNEAFPNGIPCNTAVGAHRLALPALLVEAEATAVIGSARTTAP